MSMERTMASREFKFEVRHSPNISFHGTPTRALHGSGPVNPIR